MNYKLQEKATFKEWNKLTYEEKKARKLPCNITDYAVKNGLSQQTLYKWRNEDVNKRDMDTLKPSPFVENIKKEVMAEKASFDSKLFLKSKIKEVCERLMDKINSNKANAKDFELYYKLIGQLDQKKEDEKKEDVTINIANLIGIARQQLKDGGNGDIREIEMPNVATILSGKVRLNSGQGDSQQSTVPAVGLSEEPAQSDSGQ